MACLLLCLACLYQRALEATGAYSDAAEVLDQCVAMYAALDGPHSSTVVKQLKSLWVRGMDLRALSLAPSLAPLLVARHSTRASEQGQMGLTDHAAVFSLPPAPLRPVLPARCYTKSSTTRTRPSLC